MRRQRQSTRHARIRGTAVRMRRDAQTWRRRAWLPACRPVTRRGSPPQTWSRTWIPLRFQAVLSYLFQIEDGPLWK